MIFTPSSTLAPHALQDAPKDAFAAVICGKEILLKSVSGTPADSTSADPASAELPRVRDLLPLFSSSPALSVGELDGVPFPALQLKELPQELPNSLFLSQTRSLLASFPQGLCTAVCRARILLSWREKNLFCGVCSAPLKDSRTDIGRICEKCGNRVYPQISPAVIVLVTRGEEILLAHNRQFTNGMFGLVAGFVEAGEGLEEAVRRELREEVGIEVKELTYKRSQSWPFPNSLMFGFRALYDSGTLRADGTELDQAGWFRADALPMIPPPGSIARTLIDEWLLNQHSCAEVKLTETDGKLTELTETDGIDRN